MTTRSRSKTASDEPIDLSAVDVAEEPATIVAGIDRELTVDDIEEVVGRDERHERRLEVAHQCAERFAGMALPSVLNHHYVQGKQRLVEWLAITDRSLDELPGPDEIPAVVRYHWRMAGF